MKTLVLLNPAAGGGHDADSIRSELADLPDVEFHASESADDGRRAVRAALEDGVERFVVAGGDGTLHAALNAIAPDFEGITLGVLPLGTANDFARSLSLPLDLPEALETIRAGHTRPLDLLEVRLGSDGERRRIYCANGVTGGFAGRVSLDADEKVKKGWGRLSYLRTAVKRLGELDRWWVSLELDDEPFAGPDGTEVLNLVVANGRKAGGSVPVAPEADPGDGLADVVLIHGMPAQKLALLAPRVLAGKHLGEEGVEFRRGHVVRIRSRPPMPYSLDGEPLVSDDAEVRVLPRVLRVLVPPPGGRD